MKKKVVMEKQEIRKLTGKKGWAKLFSMRLGIWVKMRAEQHSEVAARYFDFACKREGKEVKILETKKHVIILAR